MPTPFHILSASVWHLTLALRSFNHALLLGNAGKNFCPVSSKEALI